MPPLNFDTLKLSTGAHEPDGEACVMEATSQLAGLPWSDHPSCTADDIAAYARILNDSMSDHCRTEFLKPLLRRLTRANGGNAAARRFFWADAAIHIFAPPALDATGHPELRNHAKALRGLPTISDSNSCRVAARAAAAAYDDAAAISAANAAGTDAARTDAAHIDAARAAVFAAAISAANAANAACTARAAAIFAANAAVYAAANAAAAVNAAANAAARTDATRAAIFADRTDAARAAANAAVFAAAAVHARAAADVNGELKIWNIAVKTLMDAIQEAEVPR
jgi:hypothetical protein